MAAPNPAAAPTGRGRRSARIAVAAVMVATVLVGCASKSPAELATEELNAGLAASTSGNEAEAKAHYEACVKHDASNQFCIYNLGVIAGRNNQMLEAENAYRLALLIDPNLSSAAFNLALIRASSPNGLDEAIALYQHYIELRPEDSGGYLNLGLLLRANGRQADGDALLAKALQLDPAIVIPPVSPSAPASASPGSSPAPSPSQ